MSTYWVSPTGTASWAAASSLTPLSGSSCASLAAANNSVSAGDVVYLRGGLYDAGIILNSKNGTAVNKICFLAYSDEVPVLENTTIAFFAGRYHGVMLRYCDYIKISGVQCKRVSGGYLFQIVNRSTHNEVAYCTFDGNGASSIINIYSGSVDPLVDASDHNWIHHCVIKNTGELAGNPVNDLGGMQIGNYLGSYGFEQVSGNNTVEDCIFYGGGHHNLETFSRRNIIRRNYFHHEGSMPNNTGNTPLYGPDTNGLWGNRNISIYDGNTSDGMFNLFEGNRFGHSGPPPDDDGGDSIALTAPKNILRYNIIFNSLNNGIYFKYGAGAVSDNNRFYNNTIFKSGRFQNTGGQWQGSSFRCAGVYRVCNIESIVGSGGTVTCRLTSATWMVPGSTAIIKLTSGFNGSYTILSVTSDSLQFTFAKVGDIAEETTGTAEGRGPQKGNVCINNIYNTFGGASELIVPQFWANYNVNESELVTTDGDPLFINTDVSDPFSLTHPNLDIDGASPATNAGARLTLSNGAGNAATTLIVDDALFFQDGTWGSSLAALEADWIAVGTVGNVAQISSIDYATNTITLASPLTWADNAEVWLYKDSSGAQVLFGSAPNIGAGFVSGPLAPSALSAAAISTSVVYLGWTNNALDATGIRIERSSDNSTFTQIADIGPDETSYSVTGLASGTQYWFRVRAYNAHGNSAYSNTATATTDAAPVVGPGRILTGFIGFW